MRNRFKAGDEARGGQPARPGGNYEPLISPHRQRPGSWLVSYCGVSTGSVAGCSGAEGEEIMGEMADAIVGDMVDGPECPLCGQTEGFCYCNPEEQEDPYQ